MRLRKHSARCERAANVSTFIEAGRVTLTAAAESGHLVGAAGRLHRRLGRRIESLDHQLGRILRNEVSGTAASAIPVRVKNGTTASDERTYVTWT